MTINLSDLINVYIKNKFKKIDIYLLNYNYNNEYTEIA